MTRKNQLPLVLSAAAGSFLTTAVVTPFDVLKTVLQVGGKFPVNLYRGFNYTLLANVPSTVIYYTLYENLQFHPFLSGALARLVAVLITNPIEVLKTRAQAGMRSTHSLYNGLASTLWRDIPFSAVYWYTLESIRPSNPTPFTTFYTACISGTLAAVLTHPFDVAKTIQQVEANPKSTLSVLYKIHGMHGMRGLYRGLVPRIGRIAPACGIMLATFDYGKTVLGA